MFNLEYWQCVIIYHNPGNGHVRLFFTFPGKKFASVKIGYLKNKLVVHTHRPDWFEMIYIESLRWISSFDNKERWRWIRHREMSIWYANIFKPRMWDRKLCKLHHFEMGKIFFFSSGIFFSSIYYFQSIFFTIPCFNRNHFAKVYLHDCDSCCWYSDLNIIQKKRAYTKKSYFPK